MPRLGCPDRMAGGAPAPAPQEPMPETDRQEDARVLSPPSPARDWTGRPGSRDGKGVGRWLVPLLAGSWSLFQLSLPSLVSLNSDIVRTIHFVFAISLVYLTHPAFKKPRFRGKWLRWTGQADSVPRVDLVLMVCAGFSAGYYVLDYEGIMGRQNLPIARDYVVGIMLVVLLLEAARRSLGPALPVVASGFIGLCFIGERLPGFLAFKNIPPSQALTQLTMTTEGIYGVPLYVSANVVFLFVLFGALLEKSGGGHYFVQLAFSLLGRFRGGPAKAAVLASGMTGLVSGSSIANTVTTGTFTIPLMIKCGYPREKAAAIEVAASTNGQLMPPVMGAAALIIAERCNMEYLAVVRAAFVPAIVSYIALIYITHLEAAKLGLKGLPKEELPSFFPTFLGGIHFLAPLALLVGLLLRRFSPQLAAFWAILALAALVVLREQLRCARQGSSRLAALRRSASLLWESLVTGGRNMTGIGVAVAAAGIIVGIMTLGPGGRVSEAVTWIAGNNLLIMLVVTALISLVLGMGLPTTANYIVVSTVVVPPILLTANRAGFAVPLIAAHLYCFFFGILADDTPPVGLAAYAASAIAKSRPIPTGIQGFVYDLRTAILPFMFFFNTRLLLIGVDSFLQAAVVFVTATVAMLAFASATQRWLLIRTHWYESLLLGAVCAVLLRPDLMPWGTRLTWYGVGCATFAGVAIWQAMRSPAGGAASRAREGG